MADTKTMMERAYTAFNKRDIDGAPALVTQDVSWPKAARRSAKFSSFGESGADREAAR